MKVEVKEGLVEKVLEYPKLMISNEGKLVFFIREECGFRIDDNYHYSSGWAMPCFKDFKGELTIIQ